MDNPLVNGQVPAVRDPFRQWTDRIGSVRGRTGMSPTGDSAEGGAKDGRERRRITEDNMESMGLLSLVCRKWRCVFPKNKVKARCILKR